MAALTLARPLPSTLFFLLLDATVVSLGALPSHDFPVSDCVIYQSYINFYFQPLIQVLLWSSDRSARGPAPGHLIQSE